MSRSNLYRLTILIAVLALFGAAGTGWAQTPDDFPPANEGVCDDLAYATPGLYGLCIAFCEAQDCELDFGLEDPFENCVPGSQKVLARYEAKMQEGDPSMWRRPGRRRWG